jgi:hypothetical protein
MAAIRLFEKITAVITLHKYKQSAAQPEVSRAARPPLRLGEQPDLSDPRQLNLYRTLDMAG